MQPKFESCNENLHFETGGRQAVVLVGDYLRSLYFMTLANAENLAAL